MRKTQKTTAVVGGTVAAVLVGGVAFAFWTTSGGGDGSAQTSAGDANLSVVQDFAPDNLFPGKGAEDLSVTVTNNADNNAKVQAVTAWLEVTQADGAVGSCNASDYVLSNAAGTNASTSAASALTAVPLTMTPADLANGATLTATGKLGFNNKLTEQDGCKGATVTIHYIAS